MISRTMDVTHVMTLHCTTSRKTAMRNSWLLTHVSANMLTNDSSDTTAGAVDVGSHAHVTFM